MSNPEQINSSIMFNLQVIICNQTALQIIENVMVYLFSINDS